MDGMDDVWSLLEDDYTAMSDSNVRVNEAAMRDANVRVNEAHLRMLGLTNSRTSERKNPKRRQKIASTNGSSTIGADEGRDGYGTRYVDRV